MMNYVSFIIILTFSSKVPYKKIILQTILKMVIIFNRRVAVKCHKNS